ncbi:MAG TPA: hypothetical protein ENO22_14335 [candidate division Zixibacteria bacterium]|nr:hypothetical protein [candidate division Zixibacteria bacterium]
MTDTLAYLRGHRLWLIRDFVVWGSMSAQEFTFLITTPDQATRRIMFLSAPLGGDLQKVDFADLTDFRGNNLPESLSNPKVIPLSKGSVGAVVVGREDAGSFSIAKASQSDANVICDLLIMEVG